MLKVLPRLTFEALEKGDIVFAIYLVQAQTIGLRRNRQNAIERLRQAAAAKRAKKQL